MGQLGSAWLVIEQKVVFDLKKRIEKKRNLDYRILIVQHLTYFDVDIGSKFIVRSETCLMEIASTVPRFLQPWFVFQPMHVRHYF